MSNSIFDVIVVGVGGMGSATVCELARRGQRVLALEQFAIGHDQGSSHGQTRIIRQAYFEHPDYVPLVRRAHERWYDLEQQQETHLLTECACLSIGRPDSELILGVKRSAREHSLSIESLSAKDLRLRHPQFRFGEEYIGVLEHTAGFLYVEECVQAHVREAQRRGAVIHDNEPVEKWKVTPAGVEVRTNRGHYSAAKLVLTAGPWAMRMLAQCGVPLTIMRQVPLWFGTSDNKSFRRDFFPVYIADTPEGYFYGLPVLDSNGAKVARHYGAPESSNLADIVREVTPHDEEVVRNFLRVNLPGIDGPLRRSTVCIYTLTPDRHFVIDFHPEHSNVVIAAGFSGHGFKFAPVVGEALADLVEQGSTALPIRMFRATRFIKK